MFSFFLISVHKVAFMFWMYTFYISVVSIHIHRRCPYFAEDFWYFRWLIIRYRKGLKKSRGIEQPVKYGTATGSKG